MSAKLISNENESINVTANQLWRIAISNGVMAIENKRNININRKLM